MKPFELAIPDNLDQASFEGGPEAVYKAAGIDLIDRLKERVIAPKTLIDLLPMKAQLGSVEATDTGISIGALVTLNDLAHSDALADPAFAALRTAAEEAATPLIRNRATVGGNLLQETRCWYYRSEAFKCAHDRRGPICLAIEGNNRYHSIMGMTDCMRVHPSSLAPVLYALGAEVTIKKGEAATRRIPLPQLYPDVPLAALNENTLEDGEIVTHVHVRKPVAGTRSAYRESREKLSHDWPTTLSAVSMTIEGGAIRAASICLGAVGPLPMPKPAAAKLLIGQAPNDELFDKVSKAAFADATPLLHNEYKVEVGQAVLRAALAAAAER